MSSTDPDSRPGGDEFVEITRGAQPRAASCIVAIGYNRLEPLRRLLKSLAEANYREPADLLISIDGGNSAESMAAGLRDFAWPHGALSIRYARRNLGLRRHVLSCGDVVLSGYEALIMLEDDIVVGPRFHSFALDAVRTYAADDAVAGISLYAPAFNEMAELPFEPDGVRSAAVYALQSAQSWGQCWSRDMWHGFREWYGNHDGPLAPAADLPAKIYSWPASSWKKYAMKYAVATGRTWIYPYVSHTTNFSETGTHNPFVTALYQRPLDNGPDGWALPALGELVSYDAFFERLPDGPSGLPDDFCFDLYATKSRIDGPATLATTRCPDLPKVDGFAAALRPHEVNVLRGVSGDDIGLYRIAAGSSVDLADVPARAHLAYHANMGWKPALRMGLQGFRHAVTRRLGARRK